MTIRTVFAPLILLLAAFAFACGGDGESIETTNNPATATPSGDGTNAEFAFDCASDYPGTAPDGAAFPVDVTDGSGRTVTVEAPPQSIASLSAAHTEALFAIGAGDQVAAVDNTSDCPQAAQDLQQVDAFNVSVESVTALEPDMVVLFFDPGDLVTSLEQQLGVPVLLYPSPPDIDGIYRQIESLGQATGHTAEAQQLTTGMRSAIAAVASAAAAEPAAGPTVYHELDNTYFSIGPGSFLHDMYEKLGATNIAEDTGQAFPQLSAEAIIAANPDVIILADEGLGETAESVAARAGWDAIAAVQDSRIYGIDPDIVSRPGPRIVEAMRLLAGYLYPELQQ